MEDLLLLGPSKERTNYVQMGYDYIKMNEIIERIFSNEYNDDSLKRIKYILNYSYKTSDGYRCSIELINEYLLTLIKDGILNKEPASEYFSTPIFRVYSDNYYLLRHVIDYMALEDKRKGFSASSNSAQFIRTGKITSFDQQTASELHECSTLGDLELLRYLLHKTYDLNVKTADAIQLNYQSIMINSIINMLLIRKVITEDEFSQPNFDVSIRVKQKKYFINKRYLARL